MYTPGVNDPMADMHTCTYRCTYRCTCMCTTVNANLDHTLNMHMYKLCSCILCTHPQGCRVQCSAVHTQHMNAGTDVSHMYMCRQKT